MNWPKLLIDALYWAIAFQLFLFFVDSYSVVNFNASAYGIFGFILLYFYTIVMLSLIRVGDPPKNNR